LYIIIILGKIVVDYPSILYSSAMSMGDFNNFCIYTPTAFIPVEELKSLERYKVVLASNVVFNT